MRKISLGVMLAFSLGCGDFQATTKMSQLQSVSESSKVEQSERPYCEVDFADYKLDTHLLAFEIFDKKDIGFGFNLLSGFFKAFGLKFKTEKGTMLAAMHMRETLRPSESLADVTGNGESKRSEFNFELDAAQLALNLGYFYQTPLSLLTEKTIANTLSHLQSEMSAVETPWSTRAVHLYPVDQQLIVPAGSVAGIRMGDQFGIYNVDYAWRGEPCVSELLFERKKTTEPMAILQVTQLDKNASLLTIIEKRTDDPIEYGARLEIHKLILGKKEKSRTLKRAVRLGEFKSEKLVVPGGANVDLSLYISEQTQALLDKYGYYPRK
jgi:hypothetical protein